MSCACCKICARVRSSFRTGSPYFKIVTVVEGGCVSKVIMLDEAFFRNPWVLILEIVSNAERIILRLNA